MRVTLLTRAKLVFVLFLTVICATLLLPDTSWAQSAVSFQKGALQGEISTNPTSLQFGPTAGCTSPSRTASSRRYTVARNGREQLRRDRDRDDQPRSRTIPNHNDDGSLNPARPSRLVTGILVTGTAANPVIYVASSDPRIGGGVIRHGHEPRHQLGHPLPADVERHVAGTSSTWCAACRARRRTTPSNGMAARRGDQHAVHRSGRQHQQGRALEQLRPPARVRAVGGDPLDRPRRHRQHDLRPADARRRDRAGRPPTPNDPFGGQRRQEPGEARPRRAGAGVLARLPQPLRRGHHPEPAGCTRSTTAPTPAGATCPVRRTAPRGQLHQRASTSRAPPTPTACTSSPARATTAATPTRRAATWPTPSTPQPAVAGRDGQSRGVRLPRRPGPRTAR